MIVALIGKNKMLKTNLPKFTIGNYAINDENGRKIINIESKNGNWQIVNNNSIKIVNAEHINNKEKINLDNIREVTLKEHNLYYVSFSNMKEIFILYCSPDCESFTHLDVKKSSEITIGSNKNNNISYSSPLVKSKHARIFYSNGRLMLENFDKDYGCFINNRPVFNENKLLFNGDVIFIMGLKIIIMGKSIFINNPLEKVDYDRKMFSINEKEYNLSNLKEEDESDLEIYSEKDYFAKAPRIRNIIEKEKVKIDAPPQIQSKEGMPLIYVLGTTLSMGVVMIISTFSTIDGLISGTATFKDTMFSLLMSLAMLVSIILIPVLNVRYEKKQKIKYEEKRQKRYKDYINSKIELIDSIMKKQRKILFENYVSVEECNNIIATKNSRLWERNIEDFDFLTVRLGIGDVPLEIDIEYPEEQFAMEDDNLVEMLSEIGNKSKILKDAPITVSLAKRNISALIVQDNQKLVEKFIQSLIMQLITFHSYEDLKLVFLLKEDKDNKWEHIKMLPHVWNNTKQIRFFADDYNEMKEISRYLEEEINSRTTRDDELDYKAFMPYYLIITDDYKKIENLKIITEILEKKVNVGFSILCISDSLTQLPNECKTFISLTNNEGMMFESEISSTNQSKFKFDDSYTFFFEKICKEISNIPIKYTASGQKMLPSSYGFLEMYDVGKIEQLNILERWKRNDSTISLQAPIGIDSAGMPIVLDIHEKFHGPHGLIAGSTGSGKSEFIITYILSLAINYHPDDVAFILIDYKGGGLAGAFQKRDIKLPHLVGTITNIDTVGLQRSLASIQSELKRRQVMFNEARNRIDEGTIDIYKYQKLYHEGIVEEPIPHLLIICDEFAELKQQQEEFMDELISVARIGRSLGVHLILATQKPAGIVNEQIRSNSKFGICLKVQSTEDSTDVINRPDAAYLKRAGQFYMQVGNNEYFTLGLSAYSGLPYMPSDVTKKKINNSLEIISNIGTVLKEVSNSKQVKLDNKGEQLTNIVKYMYKLAKQENIESKQLWMDNIPETIFLENTREKYKIENEENIIAPVIGEYDDPYNQRQGVVKLDLSNNGNTIIYGNADSGKETLLSTIVYDTMTNYNPEDVQMYLFDFGSEALKIFKKSPHVGDIVFMNDTEKVDRFFEMLQKEIRERTDILSDYGGDYNLYIKTSGNKMPMLIVIINNYEAFSENYEDKYDDIFLMLTREGTKCGIVFIITTSACNDVRYRLAQNFRQKIALQLNNEDDYFNIFDGIGKKRPSNIFGRGLVRLEDIYEFQTAKICEPEKWNLTIKNKIDELNKIYKIKAKHIPTLPDKVEMNDIKDYLKDLTAVPIGISKKNLDVYTYNFKKSFVNIITSKNIESSIEFISHILEEVKQLENTNIVLFDSERVLQNKKVNLGLNYKNFVLGIENNLNKNKQVICIIIGIDKFLNYLENGEEDLYETFKKAEELENYSFVIIDNASKLKNREYDEWYKEYVSGDTGIWIGNGISDQYLINVNTANKEVINSCGDSFGYVIKQEEPYLIKLLGMKQKGEENG